MTTGPCHRLRLFWLSRDRIADRAKCKTPVITKKEERIARCLQSVQWADEIVVFDSGSMDSTVAICRKWTPHVYEADWPGYGVQKGRALAKATWRLGALYRRRRGNNGRLAAGDSGPRGARRRRARRLQNSPAQQSVWYVPTPPALFTCTMRTPTAAVVSTTSAFSNRSWNRAPHAP